MVSNDLDGRRLGRSHHRHPFQESDLRLGVVESASRPDERAVFVVFLDGFSDPIDHFVHQSIESDLFDDAVDVVARHDSGLHVASCSRWRQQRCHRADGSCLEAGVPTCLFMGQLP